MVGRIQGRNIMKEGYGGGKLLNSGLLGSVVQGKGQKEARIRYRDSVQYLLPQTSPYPFKL